MSETAFPVTEANGSNWPNVGMSIRDYFAAKAMQGYIVGVDHPNYSNMAQIAYEVADAMLKAREKP